jgi:hypothetical protein
MFSIVDSIVKLTQMKLQLFYDSDYINLLTYTFKKVKILPKMSVTCMDLNYICRRIVCQ